MRVRLLCIRFVEFNFSQECHGTEVDVEECCSTYIVKLACQERENLIWCSRSLILLKHKPTVRWSLWESLKDRFATVKASEQISFCIYTYIGIYIYTRSIFFFFFFFFSWFTVHRLKDQHCWLATSRSK